MGRPKPGRSAVGMPPADIARLHIPWSQNPHPHLRSGSKHCTQASALVAQLGEMRESDHDSKQRALRRRARKTRHATTAEMRTSIAMPAATPPMSSAEAPPSSAGVAGDRGARSSTPLATPPAGRGADDEAGAVGAGALSLAWKSRTPCAGYGHSHRHITHLGRFRVFGRSRLCRPAIQPQSTLATRQSQSTAAVGSHGLGCAPHASR